MKRTKDSFDKAITKQTGHDSNLKLLQKRIESLIKKKKELQKDREKLADTIY
jgi:hypothetical protein